MHFTPNVDPAVWKTVRGSRGDYKWQLGIISVIFVCQQSQIPTSSVAFKILV